jgi:hypothetical protein
MSAIIRDGRWHAYQDDQDARAIDVQPRERNLRYEKNARSVCSLHEVLQDLVAIGRLVVPVELLNVDASEVEALVHA